ncbi:hypothetical protein H5410_044474 [Solanum commersonii]|uniref:Secreted protein n=1 Tax=Solanum commersonii TaxID=4109 RepID=A0A9J5XB03_SOLCO|nr:hypothetical protein H5410_044474 [Solanum commersonii]
MANRRLLYSFLFLYISLKLCSRFLFSPMTCAAFKSVSQALLKISVSLRRPMQPLNFCLKVCSTFVFVSDDLRSLFYVNDRKSTSFVSATCLLFIYLPPTNTFEGCILYFYLLPL